MHANKMKMKINKLMYSLMLLGLSFVMTNHAMAQSPDSPSPEMNTRIDSMDRVHDAEDRKQKSDDAIKTQDKKDAENLSELKSQKADTRVKANEAQKVEREASDAAKESKNAYKSEKKAQKARNKADKQAKKAAKARSISDNN
jgi:hypothetical protein